jgi:hypothetical protein
MCAHHDWRSAVTDDAVRGSDRGPDEWAVERSEAAYAAAADAADTAHEALGDAEDRIAALGPNGERSQVRAAEDAWAERLEDADAASLQRQRASDVMRDARETRDRNRAPGG